MAAKKEPTSKKTHKTTKKNKPKSIILRAFLIKNHKLSTPNSMIYEKLIYKLNSSETSEARCMILNEEDENKERDVISSYTKSDTIEAVSCTIMRLASSKDLPNIPDKLLKKKIFSMDDLEESLPGTICKDHYYFSLSNDYLVTCWSGNKTVNNLQTYIRWLINDELVEFTHVISPPPDIKLSDLKSITYADPKPTSEIDNKTLGNANNSPDTIAKSFDLGRKALDLVTDLLRSTEKLDETELRQLISATLLIKFKKPRKMSDEEYARKLGAILKPVSDMDYVQFATYKKDKIINGKDLLKQKVLDIDTTDNGKISEPALYQEMINFLYELKENEKTNN